MAITHMSSFTSGTRQPERRWSYASGASDIPLLGQTIGDLLDQTIDRYPDRLAYVARHQGIRWTYREFQVQIHRCAKGLIDAFPMTVTGKIQKFIMRKQAIEELGLQQAASIKTA